MKWYRRHRPKVHWYFWLVILVLSCSMLVFFAWADSQVETSLTGAIVGQILVSILAYSCIRYWQWWIDNPDEYEKVQQARLRGLRGRLVRRRSRKKKKDSPKG